QPPTARRATTRLLLLGSSKCFWPLRLLTASFRRTARGLISDKITVGRSPCAAAGVILNDVYPQDLTEPVIPSRVFDPDGPMLIPIYGNADRVFLHKP